jgi:hypothetical protein
MSSNAPKVQQQQNDPFTPKTTQGGFWRARRVGKGKNRHWDFRGRQQDEVVKAVLRKHVYFLITPAFPLIGSIIGLLLMFVLSGAYPSAGSLWALLQLVFAILIVFTAVYFLYNDLALWWVETDIITNQRVLIWKGLLSPNRKEAPVENVVQVGVDQTSLTSILLSYGDVHLNLVGGKGLILEKVANPKKVRDLFNEVTEEAKRNKPPKEKHPQPANADLLAVLAKLSENEPLPKLDNPDEKYARFHRPDKVHGPLRTFAGPLRLPCDVTYTTDEQTVKYIQRSKSVLVVRLILPVLIVIGLIISLVIFPSLDVFLAIAIFIMFFVITYTTINYVDDVFILTNKRIIDIDRKFLFFNEEHVSADYEQVRDITVDIGNPLFLALDVGTVTVQTPGDNPNIEISPADHPFSIQDTIVALKDLKGKVEKLNSNNERKNQLNEWFGTVLATIENGVLGRGVPNLQKMDLFKAADLASQLGMKVVPVGEDSTYPNIAPGLIVSQNPIPGTLVHVGSNDSEMRPQIRVILSSSP